MSEEQVINDIPLCYYEYMLVSNHGEPIPPTTGNIFYAAPTRNYIVKEWEEHFKRNRHDFTTYELIANSKRAKNERVTIICKEMLNYDR